jgi:cytochrome c556
MSPLKSRKLVAIASLAAAVAATALAGPPERAKPPAWTDADVEPFFSDAREALVGERPATTTAAAAIASAGSTAAAHGFEWSQLVEGETLATEVKRAAARLAAPLANPAAFKAGGNNDCRVEFGFLAELFAVIDQFDGDVRWKSDAAAMRDALTRASANCKSASDQSFTEAMRLRGELDDLIRGSRLGGAAPPPAERWSTIADRALLMKRMQRAMQEGVNPRMSDAATFAKAAVDVRHEAEVLALLAEVIRREEYEFWDDETFVDYSRELGAAAGELSRAAADQNYEAARAAAGRAGQACATCHDGYRL